MILRVRIVYLTRDHELILYLFGIISLIPNNVYIERRVKPIQAGMVCRFGYDMHALTLNWHDTGMKPSTGGYFIQN